MKKGIIITLLLMATSHIAFAYADFDFSSVVPSGQTLYFEYLTDSTVSVTHPDSNPSYGWQGYTKPTGHLVIPNSIERNGTTLRITFINEYAFNDCYGITSVKIDSSISQVGYYAFKNCSVLDTVFFYADSCIDNMNYSYSPFKDCPNLTTIIIGENVKHIPNGLFYYCTSISSVELRGEVPPTCNCNSFAYTTISNATFNIPCHTRENYESVWWCGNYRFEEPESPNFTVSFSPEWTNLPSLEDSLMGYSHFNPYGLRCDSSAVIVGTPYYGYKFVAWQDGNTSNPRTVNLSSDSAFTALFTKRMFHIYPESSDTSVGTVSNPDSALYRDTLTITAYPKHGYELWYWEYTDTNLNTYEIMNNPVSFAMTKNIWPTAYFTPMTLNVQFIAETNMGYIQAETWEWSGDYGGGPVYRWHSHSGSFHYGDSVRITANHHWGYRFKQWSDGCTDNPRYLKLIQDTIITAQFDRDSAWITVVSADATLGTVSGTGWYAIYDTAIIEATPAEHYHLKEWVVDIPYSYSYYDPYSNPLYLYVENEGTVTALFAIDTHTVSVASNDILRGNVEGGGMFEYGTPCTITATAYSGYRFVRWSNGVTYNPYTFAVTTDMELTAIFVEEGSIFNITATTADPTMGTVTGGGPYGVGEEAVLTAIPNTGYQFDHWDDGNTMNPRTITVSADASFTAYFVATQRIDDVIPDVAVNVYVLGSQIVVETNLKDEIGIYDIVGRKVDGGRKSRFEVHASGVYFVKIGSLPMQKVVVVCN